MLIIRLARVGRRNHPAFRLVLTEHTKPSKSWYTEVLGSFNPLQHEFIANVTRIEELLPNGVQMSERVAKLMYNQTQNDVYKKFFTHKTSHKTTKNPDKYES